MCDPGQSEAARADHWTSGLEGVSWGAWHSREGRIHRPDSQSSIYFRASFLAADKHYQTYEREQINLEFTKKKKEEEEEEKVV